MASLLDMVGLSPEMKDRVEGTISYNVLMDLFNAAKLPGDVYTGKVSPHSDEAKDRAAGLADLALVGAPAALRATPNVLYAFAGPSAKTADHAALKTAKEMTAKKASADDIWYRTGWFKGLDGKWRFEINDSELRTDPFRIPELTFDRSYKRYIGFEPVEEVMDHPLLYEAYPELRRTGIGSAREMPEDYLAATTKDALGNESIAVSPALVKHPKKFGLDSSIMHEMQHMIQYLEDFSRGTSENLIFGRHGQYYHPFMKGLMEEANMGPLMAAQQIYRNQMGEVEARLVESRLGLSEGARKFIPPFRQYSVAPEYQIPSPPGWAYDEGYETKQLLNFLANGGI